MSTYREHETRDGDHVVVEDAETVITETEVAPPVPPPPGAAPPRFVTSERVVVDDPAGTRVTQRDVRTPLPPDEDIRRWNWLTPALVFILLAALGIVLAAILLTNDDDNKSSSTPSTVTATLPPANTSIGVPTVVGQSRAGAEETLRSQGFTVVVATVPSPDPAGLVLAQNPPAGTGASDGATVRINVSDGSQSVAGAQTQTQPAQTQTTQSSSSATPSQQTPSNSSSGSSSSGSAQPAPTPVSVPSVSSGDMKSAVQSLSNAGLLASIQYVPSDEPLGAVVSQSPSDGSSTKTGSHVTLSVSSGPGDKPRHSVPDASGQTIPQAVQAMNGAGLRLVMVKKTVTDQTQAGKVVEQTPQPGAQAPENAQIVVYMGAFKG